MSSTKIHCNIFFLVSLRYSYLVFRGGSCVNSSGECRADVERCLPSFRAKMQVTLTKACDWRCFCSCCLRRLNSAPAKDQLLLLSNFVPPVLYRDGQAISSRLKVAVFILVFVFFHKCCGFQWMCCSILYITCKVSFNHCRNTCKD